MKTFAKRIYYSLRQFPLPKELNLKLGYIFHTEEVYKNQHYSNLIGFCKEYTSITGKLPICTVMAGTSPKVAAGLRHYKCSHEELADRYKKLGEFATLGYHGHFYLNPYHYDRYESEIRSNNFVATSLKNQFSKDLEWFSKHKISHNGLYAAGWWFINRELLSLLIENGFKFDFSFSKHIHFLNQYSLKIFNEYKIQTGDSFKISIPTFGSITEIQNLIGTPSTPFIQDFNRHLLKIIKDKRNVIGLINSHDYDLDLKNTLNLFKELASLPQVDFFDATDLILKKIDLKTEVVNI